jgi:hypothetical protein
MESGLTSVVVKWDKKEIDFSEEQFEKIITDFEYLQEVPIDQEELIEEGGADQ